LRRILDLAAAPADGLHLNEKSYALWTRLLRPYLGP